MTSKMALNPERLAPVHQGEILKDEFLLPMNITQYRLAKVIGVDARRIHSIVHGERPSPQRQPCCSRGSSEIPLSSGWGCKASMTWKLSRTGYLIS